MANYRETIYKYYVKIVESGSLQRQQELCDRTCHRGANNFELSIFRHGVMVIVYLLLFMFIIGGDRWQPIKRQGRVECGEDILQYIIMSSNSLLIRYWQESTLRIK